MHDIHIFFILILLSESDSMESEDSQSLDFKSASGSTGASYFLCNEALVLNI